MLKLNVTRGYGLLEGFLAKQRSKTADKLIPLTYRKGRILDIGCGTYPLFLMKTEFNEKYGIDKLVRGDISKYFQNQKITVITSNLEKEDVLPFNNEYFDVVTMLAFFEHIERKRLTKILKEVYRILKPGGIYIMTTPAVWTDRLLRLMATLRLVSSAEIEEHKDSYNHLRISSILQEANFLKKKLQFGYFEMFMNIWATGIK